MNGKVFRSVLFVALMAGILGLTAYGAGATDLQIGTTRSGTTVAIEKVIDEGNALVSVVDAENKAVSGLGVADFSVSQAGNAGKIVSVQQMSENVKVSRHIVLVLDNSYSMEERNAIKPLLAGVGELLKTVRPVDDVRIVVFDDKKTQKMGGRDLHVQTFKSNKPAELQAFVDKAYGKKVVTRKTVLHEAMLAGLELIKKMPATDPRFLVVFSDGEDLNSAFKQADVLGEVKKLDRFTAYAIDYMPVPEKDKFLVQFASQNRGQVWKAATESNIVSIFQSVASEMLYSYVVSYVFPPSGKLAVTPASLTVEEIKTIDSSPMLGYVFFASGSGEIGSQYVRFAGPAETAGFDVQKLGGTLEKYYQLLNVVGKRMIEYPEAKITLVGCNDNTGVEKGNRKLSAQRAEAVKNYLQTIWNIASERITVEARDLPAKPSSGKLKEGREENRRVEILSTEPMILAPIRTVYFANRLDAPELKVRPEVVSKAGIKTWKLSASNASGSYASLTGEGSPAAEIRMPLDKADLKALAAADVTVKMELQDRSGQSTLLSSSPVKVNFVQTSQRLAQKQDQKVQEKYALILFDFDKDTIEAINKEIVTRIAARIKEIPQSRVTIVGSTDNIGSKAYNIKLSERRALSVYKMLAAAYGDAAGERIKHSGVGPRDPLYDNKSPEARSFNRTVTITLEYMSSE